MDRIASILEAELQSKFDEDSRRDTSMAAYPSGNRDRPTHRRKPKKQSSNCTLWRMSPHPDQTIAETARMASRPRSKKHPQASRVMWHVFKRTIAHSGIAMGLDHDILEADSEDIPVRARIVAGAIIWIGE